MHPWVIYSSFKFACIQILTIFTITACTYLLNTPTVHDNVVNFVKINVSSITADTCIMYRMCLTLLSVGTIGTFITVLFGECQL